MYASVHSEMCPDTFYRLKIFFYFLIKKKMYVNVIVLIEQIFKCPFPNTAIPQSVLKASDTQVARSLPTAVPDGPQLREAVRHRTPRTPHQKKDAQSTPRFFPVMKESKSIDNKVRKDKMCW